LEQREAIVSFELGLATAQVNVDGVGSLTSAGGCGGPDWITSLPFYIGINDNMYDPEGPYDYHVVTMFDAWMGSPNSKRAAVARGQEIFNTKRFEISGVRGLNDNPYFGNPSSLSGTCTTCHNTPDIGNHSIAITLDIGISDGSRRTPDMPLYSLRNKMTGEVLSTTDPGLALSTGKWKDIGRFKGPILRSLAARAPFFHDGSAMDLPAVVDYYQQRFGIEYTSQEKADLVAFLKCL
jgi:cytochrome c peroxidase